MSQNIRSHKQLRVYQLAFETAIRIFDITRTFPSEERYSLTDQIRRSSRSVCSNIAEAWRKRRYEAAFISKLSDAEGEAAETQVWLAFAFRCRYIPKNTCDELDDTCEHIMAQIIKMVDNPHHWTLRNDTPPSSSSSRRVVASSRHLPEPE